MKSRLTKPASRAGAGAWLSLAKRTHSYILILHPPYLIGKSFLAIVYYSEEENLLIIPDSIVVFVFVQYNYFILRKLFTFY